MSITPVPSLRERFAKVVIIKVESIGLAGDPFAIAWAPFVDGSPGRESGVALASDGDSLRGSGFGGAVGSIGGFERVSKNPTLGRDLKQVPSLAELHWAFAQMLKSRAATGYVFAAMQPSPVVGHAMIQSIRYTLLREEDCPRVWDIATLMAAAGMDPALGRPEPNAPGRSLVGEAVRRGRLLFEAIDLLEPRQ